MNPVFLELPGATFELFTFLFKEISIGWNVSFSEEIVLQQVLLEMACDQA